ncbi:MAG: hypothetical protein LBV22_03370 [Mycoplasmataceae bacterium]|nr:hypothetical protein [Mycoplasmataceae bacterium]
MTFYVSNDDILLSYNRQKIISQYQSTIQFIDAKDLTANEILVNINQLSIFDNKTTVIINNGNILNKVNADTVLKFNSIEKNIFIFINLGAREKINSTLWNGHQINILKKPSQLENKKIIQELLIKHGLTFADKEASDSFFNAMNRTSLMNNPFNIENELKKIGTYCGWKPITTDAIVMLDMGSDNIVFDVVNHLLLSRVTPLLTLFENLIVTKHSPNDIINAMVSQLFNLKITKTAIDSGLNPYRIMGELGLNENFYIYNRMVLENITLRKIDTLLENLYTLDYNILVGIVHNSYGLKTFLLENV